MCSLVIRLLRGVRESAPRLRKLRLEQRHRFGHTRQEPNAATCKAFSPGVEVLPPKGFDGSGGRGADPLGRAGGVGQSVKQFPLQLDVARFSKCCSLDNPHRPFRRRVTQLCLAAGLVRREISYTRSAGAQRTLTDPINATAHPHQRHNEVTARCALVHTSLKVRLPATERTRFAIRPTSTADLV